MNIQSNNGWDPLKEVIVGDASNAIIPSFELSMKNFMYANLSEEQISLLAEQAAKAEFENIEGPHG